MQTPDVWFRQAGEVGFDCELELKAARQAIEIFFNNPPADTFLSVNFSPQTIKAKPQAFTELVTPFLSHLVIELTEHKIVKNYVLLNKILHPLREKGLRIAIDDAGAGYASFRHILLTHPDFIKLDRSLISEICLNSDPFLLTEALVTFARKSGETIIAEGVETENELNVLKTLGVESLQGFYLGRPAPLDLSTTVPCQLKSQAYQKSGAAPHQT